MLRRTRLFLLLASFALVATACGDDTAETTEDPAATSTTAAATTTTAPAATTAPAEDGLTKVEIGALFVELFERGDVEGYEALLTPEAIFGDVRPFFGNGNPPSDVLWATASRYLAATGATHTADCVEVVNSSTIDVSCRIAESNIFYDVGEIGPNEYSWSFVIEDGLIVQLHAVSSLQINEKDLVKEYAEWIQVNYPEEYAELIFGEINFGFGGDRLTILLADSSEQEARHLELTAEWAASRG